MTGYTYNLGLAYYEVARTHGSEVALRNPAGDTITHERLDALSNRIARVLAQEGVTRGGVVCIFSQKSFEAFAAMLACLKLGAVYCNLDTTSPPQRIQKMLDTSQPEVVLHDGTDEDERPLLGHETVRQLALHGALAQRVESASEVALEQTAAITGADPAYLMFTSGSTGIPKGAVMTHANVLNFIAWGRATFDVRPGAVLTNVNPAYFDNSVFDFYVSLFNGAAMCPFDAEITRRPKDLVRAVERLGCTVWFSVPSMLVYLLTMRALGRDDLPKVRAFVFGGEGFPKPKLKELFELYGQRSRLVNVYGPTECTCICSSYVIREEDFEDMQELAPLGFIAPNFGYVIDPVDADPDFGELLLHGANVGLGYFRDPERTAKSFVQDPFDSRFARRTYRTGDLVRRSPNGYLHFKGRVDNQIKHMGYRIELEEIEAALSTLDYVDEAAVIYKTADGPGTILGFVGSRSGVSEKEILADVKALVPPYMVPKHIHCLPGLPKNQNGKIDRKSLKEKA